MTQNNSEFIEVNRDPDDISLKEIILKIKGWCNYLLLKWKVILLAAFIGGSIFLILAFLKKPIYKAELTFALQDDKGSGNGLSSAMGLASQFGLSIGGASGGGDQFSGDNLLELMKSRSVIEKALLTPVSINGTTKNMVEFYIDYNHLRDKWEGKPEEKIYFLPGADRSKFNIKQDSLLGLFHENLLKDNIVVDKLDKKLSIITVKVSTINEAFSKYFAEVLVDVVSDFYIETKTKKAAQTVRILTQQRDSVKQALSGAISGVASSIDANPNPNPSLLALRVPSQRGSIEVQTNTAMFTELVKNLEISKMSLLQETPLIQIIDKPLFPLKKTKSGLAMSFLIGFILFSVITTVTLILKKVIKDALS